MDGLVMVARFDPIISSTMPFHKDLNEPPLALAETPEARVLYSLEMASDALLAALVTCSVTV